MKNYTCGAVLLAFIPFQCLVSVAEAQSPPPLAPPADNYLKTTDIKKCRFGVENKSCSIVLGDDAAGIPTIRMNSNKSVFVEYQVFRNPFDKVEFDATTILQPDPDIAAALMKLWLDPLKSFVLSSKQSYDFKDPVSVGGFKSTTAAQPRCITALIAICKQIDALDKQVVALAESISDWSRHAEAAAKELNSLKALKKWPDAIPGMQSSPYDVLVRNITKVKLSFGDAPVDTACGNFDVNVARCELPVAAVASSREQITQVREMFSSAPVGTLAANEVVRHARISDDILRLFEKQSQLEARLADAKLVQEKLVAAADKLKEIDLDVDTRPLAVRRIKSPEATATTQVKVTSTNVWSGKVVALNSPALVWEDSRWELSAGLAVSLLKKRSFGIAPRLNANGEPVMDSTGTKVISQITKTSTSPTVFPLALANYRLGDETLKEGTTRRRATFISVGIGANDGSAEAFAGIAYSIGAFSASLGGHLGRLRKLSNGLEVDADTTITDISKFERKGWVVRPSITVAYKVPMP